MRQRDRETDNGELVQKSGEEPAQKAMSLKKDIQYNAQDLDQEQTMNPVLLNTQNLYFPKDLNEFSGKITGTTFLERNREIISGVEILLFIGHETKKAIYRTNSDEDGNFTIGDLPPGFYSLYAKPKNAYRYESYFIKVMPWQTVYQSVLISQG